jgi:hypothetical protein
LFDGFLANAGRTSLYPLSRDDFTCGYDERNEMLERLSSVPCLTPEEQLKTQSLPDGMPIRKMKNAREEKRAERRRFLKYTASTVVVAADAKYTELLCLGFFSILSR